MHWHLEKLMLDGVYQEIVVIYIHEEMYVSYHFHFRRHLIVNYEKKKQHKVSSENMLHRIITSFQDWEKISHHV